MALPPCGLDTFIEGVCGSLVIELVTAYEYYNDEDATLPKKYGKLGFWIVRTLIAVAGGGLAYLEGVRDAPVVAIHIGASTPLLLRVFGGLTEQHKKN